VLLHLQHTQEQPFIYLLENVPSLNDSRPQVLVAWQQVHVWLGKPILVHVALRRKHPWVVPLETSHFDFLGPIEL
jgi:hypothetical protein